MKIRVRVGAIEVILESDDALDLQSIALETLETLSEIAAEINSIEVE
jgi:hypothetical protein